MAHEHEPPPDVEIAASARAKEVRFDAAPVVRVRFPGTGERDSRQVTTRQNVDSPVEPGGRTAASSPARTSPAACSIPGRRWTTRLALDGGK